MRTLSDKRIRLLNLLAESQRQGEFPLVREMAASLQLAGRTSIARMLASLEAEGYIFRHGGGEERRQCIYRLTAKGESVVPLPQRLLIPILGSIPAGQLSEAVQECDRFIDPGDVLNARRGDFGLLVDGDSMIGDHILPKDIVLLRPDVEVSNGQIAAVHYRHENGMYESTLKHVDYQPGKRTVQLRASNPAYEPLVLPASKVEVVAGYRGLIRLPG